jgi:hypothetical protein
VVLDGEAMCFTKGMHDFDKLWSNCFDEAVRLCAFDLLELNGEDCRAKPLVEQAVARMSAATCGTIVPGFRGLSAAHRGDTCYACCSSAT